VREWVKSGTPHYSGRAGRESTTAGGQGAGADPLPVPVPLPGWIARTCR
jgi:hypothetical protein